VTIVSPEATLKQVSPDTSRIEPEPFADPRQRQTRLKVPDHLDDLGFSGEATTDANTSYPE
jgi:hypothetical protein